MRKSISLCTGPVAPALNTRLAGLGSELSIDASPSLDLADVPPLPRKEGEDVSPFTPLLGAVLLVLVVYLVSRVLNKK